MRPTRSICILCFKDRLEKVANCKMLLGSLSRGSIKRHMLSMENSSVVSESEGTIFPPQTTRAKRIVCKCVMRAYNPVLYQRIIFSRLDVVEEKSVSMYFSKRSCSNLNLTIEASRKGGDVHDVRAVLVMIRHCTSYF